MARGPDRRPNRAPAMSDARGREQTTARIVLQRQTPGRLRLQPSRSASSLTHQAPPERGENTGIPGIETQEEHPP
jgi:hypothetical protein